MKKKVLIIVFLMILIGAGVFYLCFFKKISLKKDTFTFEYGEQIELKADDILDTDDKTVLSSFNISTIPNEKGKNYPAIGEYSLDLEYTFQNKTYDKTITVYVEDTTKPVIKAKTNELHIVQGDESYDYQKNFDITDLSPCKAAYDSSKINTSKPGRYTLHVSAADSSNNKAELEIDVVVDKKTDNPPGSDENNSSIDNGSDSSEPFYVNGILVVNKKHPLPSSYAPQENSEAKKQLMKLIADMQKLGFDISNQYSGYRSYSYQQSLYESYVAAYGKAEADTFSARAGYSEHQTGLAFDLITSSGALLEAKPEADWVAQNAYRYGFIVRYQYGKENITGYTAEPWHLRYIGDEAKAIYDSGLTLEEYLGIEGGDYYS